MKPGIKTSEFALTLLNLLGSFGLLAGLVFTDRFLEYQMLATVLLANVTLSTGWYASCRTAVKKADSTDVSVAQG